ncbi:MAG: ScyD/ScyE family protein [Acidimicrobiales bacterium]
MLLLAGLATPAAADDGHGGGSSVKVLLTDLKSPKGLGVNAARDVVVAQGAFSDPSDPTDLGGPVLVFHTRGPAKGTADAITDPFQIVDVAISPVDDTGWAIGTDQHLYHQLADGSIVDVLDIPAYQATDPDPVDHDDPPNPTESNPYGLTVDHDGDALVADAAGNDVLRVTPDGVTTTVARFDLESVSTDHIPPDPANPLPPMFDAESVPTTVTVGPDGAIYVGELKGFPFRPGTSRIWRIKPGVTGGWCSVRTPDPSTCKTYSSGYTAIEDIAFGTDGKFYVYEFAAEGVGAFEEGFGTGQFPPAVLLEVKKSRKGERRTELAAGQFSQPGGIVVIKGKIYVTDGMFTGGRLLQIRRGGDDNHETEGHDD